MDTTLEILLRSYQPADRQACRSLWAELTQQHRDLYHDQTIGGSQPGDYFDTYLTLPELSNVWVAEVEGQAVGFTGLLVRGEEAEIEPVVVTAARRGRGVGERLVVRAVEEAQKRGVRFLNVHPVARNREAIHFFFHCGFRLVGQVELFQDLSGSTAREWEKGIDLHGQEFGF